MEEGRRRQAALRDRAQGRRRDGAGRIRGSGSNGTKSSNSAVIITGERGVAQGSQLATGDRVGQREGISAEHVDVVEPERREATDVVVAHIEAAGAELIERRVYVDCVNALIWAKGYQAPETSAAFVRARELANQVEDASERFLRLLRSLGGASEPQRTRIAARNGRPFPKRSHGPARLPRSLSRTSHLRLHLVLFRRFFQCP